MITLLRTTAKHSHFVELVKHLDADLAIRDGNDHDFYNQCNKIDAIKYAVIAYQNDTPIGCGALKEYSPTTMELKRMYTLPSSRGKGVATGVLKELENWATELGYTTIILETGINQPEAIALYHKHGYHVIANYGQYAGVENSVCFEKALQ